MSYRVSLDQFARIVGRLDKKIEKAMVRGLRSTGLRLQGIVVEEIDRAEPFPAVDRGELRNSIDYTSTESGCIVAATAPHAGVIEYGTRPFWPPIAPLAAWALRKGFAEDEEEAEEIAWGIARKFATHGMEPRSYFQKAVSRLQHDGILAAEMKRELDIATRRP